MPGPSAKSRPASISATVLRERHARHGETDAGRGEGKRRLRRHIVECVLPGGRCVRHNDHGPECGAAIADLDTGACVHWFRVDGPVGELYDLGVVPGVVRPMALGFASGEILGLIPTTHFERPRRLRVEAPNRASCQRPFRLSP